MKKFFYHAPLLFLLETFIACSFGNKTSQTENRDQLRPNILFIFADDQRADALGCAGKTYIETPNIDKLAKTGVRFSNTYVMGGHHSASISGTVPYSSSQNIYGNGDQIS